MIVSLPPGHYVMKPEALQTIKQVMLQLSDGQSLDYAARKQLAKMLYDATRDVKRIRDIVGSGCCQ